MIVSTVIIEPIGLNLFKTKTEFTLEYWHDGERYRIVIPAGFEFNQASIPRILWPIVPPSGLGKVPPLVHDYIIEEMRKHGFVRMQYYVEGIGWIWSNGRWTRKEADKMFFALMSQTMEQWPLPKGWKGRVVRWWRRRVRRGAFKAVRAWGWIQEKRGKEWG